MATTSAEIGPKGSDALEERRPGPQSRASGLGGTVTRSPSRQFAGKWDTAVSRASPARSSSRVADPDGKGAPMPDLTRLCTPVGAVRGAGSLPSRNH